MIDIEDKSGTPKYKQIVSSIENAIASGKLKKGDQIPSINEVRKRHNLSRDTVLMAFNELKNRGIINSIVGKGYYVLKESINVKQRIFLLFDELNSFKEDLYYSFLNKLGEDVQVDIFFHHFNHKVFSKLILDNVGNYNFYVIMPANLNNTNIILDNLPAEKVYILDQSHKELNKYSGVYQNFRKDINNGLTEALDLIKKYHKVILIFDEIKQPKGMLNGFLDFVNENNIEYEIIGSFDTRSIEKGEVYIIPDDKTLIKIIKKIKSTNLQLAKDIGIISYNDTLLKEIVEDGITTISTDFKEMGICLAKMIIEKKRDRIENINNLIVRKSI